MAQLDIFFNSDEFFSLFRCSMLIGINCFFLVCDDVVHIESLHES